MEKYAGSAAPIGLDIGCGKGEFAATLAQLHPERFYIGVEIRQVVAEGFFPRFKPIPNLVLLCGNINLSLPGMLAGLLLDEVYINFPDPYSHKRSLKKRRIVTPELVKGLQTVLAVNGRIFIQTDDRGLFKDMAGLLMPTFDCVSDMSRPETVVNSTGAVSDWEAERGRKGAPVYRGVLIKRSSRSVSAGVDASQTSRV